jgi:hypothetical protein
LRGEGVLDLLRFVEDPRVPPLRHEVVEVTAHERVAAHLQFRLGEPLRERRPALP